MISLDGLSSQMEGELGSQYRYFADSMHVTCRKSFRVNTLKAHSSDVSGLGCEEQVPWADGAFFYSSNVSESVEHFLGLIYIQDAASMLSALALDPAPDDVVLDLCAAPGSKTTHIAALMQNRGAVIANDVDFRRLKSLRFNLNRMGALNVAVCKSDGARFSSDIVFDKVLLDVPCSNLGQLAQNPEVLRGYSERKSQRLSQIQKRLVDAAVRVMSPGGHLVYSTCTYSVLENEAVIDYALTEHGLKPVDLGVSGVFMPALADSGDIVFDKGVACARRIYPCMYGTEGFFIAKLQR